MNMNVSQADMQGMMNRIVRLAKLDTTVFDEVRLDAGATIPSIIVAAAATLLSGLGGLLWWLVVLDVGRGDKQTGTFFFKSVIMGSIFAFALWIAWVLVVYVVLTQVLKAQADMQQLFRTMGMAAAPLALSLLIFIPKISFGVGLASVAMMFGLSTLATQATTNASPGKALVANAAGFAVWAVVLALLVGNGDPGKMYVPGFMIFGAGSGG